MEIKGIEIFNKEKDDLMKNIYVISDTHFGHWFANWFWTRPYKNLKQMNEGIIDNWNKIVTNEDIIIIVGDFFAGNKKFLNYLLDRLNGEKILVKGNHDTKRRYKKILKNGDIQIYDRLEFTHNDKLLVFTHIPTFDMPDNAINIHGHYHNVVLPPRFDKKRYFNACVEHNDFKPILLDDVLELKLNEEFTETSIKHFIEQIRFSKRNRQFAII